MQTDEQEDQDNKSALLAALPKLLGIWIVFSLVVCAMGGGFHSGPKDMPAGMSWTNADEASYSTFYVLQGGPRLILDLNKHSMVTMTVLLCGVIVLLGFLSWQGFTGHLKDRADELLSTSRQLLMGVAMGLLAVVLGFLVVGNMTLHQRLDLDSASDSVSLNGAMLARFQDVLRFRVDVSHGRKSGPHYHLYMELNGDGPVPLGGNDAGIDVEYLATKLNGYLATQRISRNP